jgi:hypothetical protein
LAGGQPNYQIYDPNTGNQPRDSAAMFPGNVIPQTRLSPQALAIMAYWPLPNTSSPRHQLRQ